MASPASLVVTVQANEHSQHSRQSQLVFCTRLFFPPPQDDDEVTKFCMMMDAEAEWDFFHTLRATELATRQLLPLTVPVALDTMPRLVPRTTIVYDDDLACSQNN